MVDNTEVVGRGETCNDGCVRSNQAVLNCEFSLFFLYPPPPQTECQHLHGKARKHTKKPKKHHRKRSASVRTKAKDGRAS